MDVEVPKLATPVVFSVKTPDALVVVHGTRFSVEVDPEGKNGNTQVDVTRGVVTVQAGGQEVWLNAGQHWPPITASAPASSSDVAPPEPAQPAARQPRAVVPSQPRAKVRRKPATVAAHQLAEENRLFGVAMAKKKAGDGQGALNAIEDFLTRYPDSVLVQEAHVERFRLFSRLGRAEEAADYARRYLGDYREGYARQEARDVALGSP